MALRGEKLFEPRRVRPIRRSVFLNRRNALLATSKHPNPQRDLRGHSGDRVRVQICKNNYFCRIFRWPRHSHLEFYLRRAESCFDDELKAMASTVARRTTSPTAARTVAERRRIFRSDLSQQNGVPTHGTVEYRVVLGINHGGPRVDQQHTRCGNEFKDAELVLRGSIGRHERRSGYFFDKKVLPNQNEFVQIRPARRKSRLGKHAMLRCRDGLLRVRVINFFLLLIREMS